MDGQWLIVVVVVNSGVGKSLVSHTAQNEWHGGSPFFFFFFLFGCGNPIEEPFSRAGLDYSVYTSLIFSVLRALD